MTADLFSEQPKTQIKFAEGAYWLQGFALSEAEALSTLLIQHLKTYPARKMMTPMGKKMSVHTTSFGAFGWVGTTKGYGYAKYDLVTNQQWPAIPELLLNLAQRATHEVGYSDFTPDTCLINVYAVGSKMGLHQDKDELDFTQPIVSVSLGIPATFLFGGAKRNEKVIKIPVMHGDVLVWGGVSRRFYHGVESIAPNQHAILGAQRINLTFRQAR